MRFSKAEQLKVEQRISAAGDIYNDLIEQTVSISWRQ